MNHSSISRRRLMAAGTGLAAMALWSGGAGAVRAAAAPLRLGVGIDPVYTAFYVAAHEGLFSAEGLDISLELYTDGGESMNALVAQQVDVSAGSEPANLLRMVRAPLRPLAVIYEGQNYIKLSARADLASAKDIKTFGVIPGTVSQYCAGLTIQQLGLDPAAITIVNSGPPELPALLARGDIDGFFAWEPWPTKAVAEGAKVMMSSADVGYRDTIWVTAADSVLQSRPDDLRALLRAMSEASRIAREEPARAAAAVKEIAKIPEELTLKIFEDITLRVRDFSEADFESYDRIAKFLVDQKVLEQPITYRPMLQNGFFKAS